MTQRTVVSGVAAVIAIGALATALLLPMYTCMDPYEFEEFPGPGGDPTCAFTDMGYRPRSWLPTKITIGAAGIVVAVTVVLWTRRRRLLAVSLVVAFIALATGWFVLDT
jgi:hypothetical protein